MATIQNIIELTARSWNLRPVEGANQATFSHREVA